MPNATDIDLARIARTTEIDSERLNAAAAFCPTCVSRRRDMRNVPAWIDGTQAAAERAEHVAPHADRGGHEHEQTGQAVERAGDGAEREAGDEVAERRDQERDEARTDPGRVRAYERDEARTDAVRELQHW